MEEVRMMENLSLQDAQDMDKILQYLIDNYDEKLIIGTQQLQRDVFPKDGIEKVYFFLKKIKELDPHIVKADIGIASLNRHQALFQANAFTQDFLKNRGGFTAVYEAEHTARMKADEIAEIDRKLKLGQLENLPWFKLTIGISIISIGIAGYSAYQAFDAQNNAYDDTQITNQIQEVNMRIDSLTSIIETLKTQEANSADSV